MTDRCVSSCQWYRLPLQAMLCIKVVKHVIHHPVSVPLFFTSHWTLETFFVALMLTKTFSIYLKAFLKLFTHISQMHYICNDWTSTNRDTRAVGCSYVCFYKELKMKIRNSQIFFVVVVFGQTEGNRSGGMTSGVQVLLTEMLLWSRA